MLGEKMGQLAEGECDPVTDGNNPRFSCHARPQPHGRIVEVNVSGEPQHVIAKTDFSAATADRDVGDYDYKDKGLFVTMSLAECRYAESYYPDGGADSSLIDAQRSMVIWAGEEYRRDYVIPTTVVDVANDGTLKVTSSGGYSADDGDALNAIARIAYEWYKMSRAILVLATTRFKSITELQIGFLVTGVGHPSIPANAHIATINSPITEIRIRNPMIPLGSTAEPTMSIITGSAELDALTIIPAPRRARRMR
jgi:hypothetical protein